MESYSPTFAIEPHWGDPGKFSVEWNHRYYHGLDKDGVLSLVSEMLDQKYRAIALPNPSDGPSYSEHLQAALDRARDQILKDIFLNDPFVRNLITHE